MSTTTASEEFIRIRKMLTGEAGRENLRLLQQHQ
jgi:hypothetical protein